MYSNAYNTKTEDNKMFAIIRTAFSEQKVCQKYGPPKKFNKKRRFLGVFYSVFFLNPENDSCFSPCGSTSAGTFSAAIAQAKRRGVLWQPIG
jgi:hypothetical protein